MKKNFFFDELIHDKLIISFSVILRKSLFIYIYIKYILYFDSAVRLIVKFVCDLIGRYKIFI